MFANSARLLELFKKDTEALDSFLSKVSGLTAESLRRDNREIAKQILPRE
jgi:hypothetical protein